MTGHASGRPLDVDPGRALGAGRTFWPLATISEVGREAVADPRSVSATPALRAASGYESRSNWKLSTIGIASARNAS